tara:strand:- start:4437 stop:5441 length:1005 start_codon:yes stop_codon:yes gene_type:complete
MSLLIDTKYIGLVSPQLKYFKRKKEYLYNCRCPLCGDSKKSSTKARGYFYRKQNGMYYKCHNCGIGHTMSGFLKELNVPLQKQYVTERWRGDDEERHSAIKEVKYTFDKPVFRKQLNTVYAVPVVDLDDAHVAKRYLVSRRVPDLNKFYFSTHFGMFVDNLVPNKYSGLKSEDPRIVIPFYDAKKNLIACQGRSIGDGSKLRYITIKVDDDAPKIYGLDTVDCKKPVFVVEGPIDSMFLSNSIAMGGADIHAIPDVDAIFVFDNERRNVDIVKRMLKIAESGFKVCVFPENLKFKDINDMILGDLLSGEVEQIINSNTYEGLTAKLKINMWKRC